MLFGSKYIEQCDNKLRAGRLAKTSNMSRRDIQKELERIQRDEKRKRTTRYIAAGIV